MKPTAQLTANPSAPSSFPLTDYNFQATTTRVRKHSSATKPATKLPAFHKLSSGLFSAEMTRDHVAELLLFAFIATTSAWPIVSMVVAVTRLVRNY